MPIIRSKRIRPLRRTSQGIALLATILLLGSAASAASRFTLVVSGKITPVEAIDSSGGRMPSAKAVLELARAIPGTGVSFDPDSGVVSVTSAAKGGGAMPSSFGGFKSAKLTFVVDGKILKTSLGKLEGGTPYLAAGDLKRLAEAMGFTAELDGPSNVLALTPPAATAGGETAATTGEGRPSWGLGGTFMEGVSTGASGAATTSANAASSGGGSVCSYMDTMKVLWMATEPTQEEKDTFQRLAVLFEQQKAAKAKGNPADLKKLEDTLLSFDFKVQRRLKGTKESSAPAAAQAWRTVSVEFLEKVDQVMKLSFDLVRIMKLPPDRQKPEVEKARKHAQRLQQINSEVQSVGARQVQETVQVRSASNCSPP